MSVENGEVMVNGDGTGLPVIDVDVLISGNGPAGGSLACFLASHGK